MTLPRTCVFGLLALACGTKPPSIEKPPVPTSSVASLHGDPPPAEETPAEIETKRAAARGRLEALKKKRRQLTADALWETAESANKQQHFKEAKEAYQALALFHPDDARAARSVEQGAFAAMRLSEFDEAVNWAEDAVELFRGTVVEARLLRELGNLYLAVPHSGTKKGGELHRGRWDQGTYVFTYKLDRAIAVRHLEEARDLFVSLAKNDVKLVPERIECELDLVGAIARFTPYDSSWAYWYYAWDQAEGDDLAEDEGADQRADEGWGYRGLFYRARPKGVPVDADGNVIFTPRPESYRRDLSDTAKIKYLLFEIGAIDPTETKEHAADALYRQALIFLARDGSQRLTNLSAWWWEGANPYKAEIESKKLEALADDEVLGLIATHVGVYKPPADENALELFSRIVREHPKTRIAERARLSVATYHQSRRQFTRAIEAYEAYLRDYPNGQLKAEAKQQIDLLRAPELKIDSSLPQLAGRNATIKVEHRNVTHLFARAMPLDMGRYIEAFEEEWIKSGGSSGSGLYPDSPQSYMLQDEKRAFKFSRGSWSSFALQVQDDGTHRYQTSEVKAPIKDEGLWLVEIYQDEAMKKRLSRAVLMLESTAVVRKEGKDGELLWIVDSRTGTPLAGAEIEAFEYWDEWPRNSTAPIHHHHLTKLKSDAQGLARLSATDRQNLITVRIGGRFAYGGTGTSSHYYPTGDEAGVLGLVFSDRPVYRPLQTVNLRVWARAKEKGRYRDPKSIKSISITVHDPKQAKVFEKLADASDGGATFSFDLPKSASLGAYTVQVMTDDSWATVEGGTFRVEEYKAPELEVTVKAGDGPAKLGASIPVKISASYYFGGPVEGARVKYKIFRAEPDEVWVAPGPWDWLYGRGYGRAYYAYPWFPWWKEWGWRPWIWYPWWGPRPAEQKELVREGQGVLQKDGSLAFDIDTRHALQAFGDRDQRFIVEAEVTDASRRTIGGKGEVLATRHQFAAHADTDRGYYQTGETIHLDLLTLLPAGDPIAVDGEVRVSKVAIRAENGDVLDEAPLITKKLKTDPAGKARFDFDAKQEGQYQLSFVAKDAWGGEVLGTTLVWVWGPSFDGRRFKFNHLELISDKRTYKVGETAKLLISSDVQGAHVLFSSKVDNGAILDPKVIALEGKTKVVSVPIDLGSVPNFFVEATLVGDGKMSEEVREIIVPPEHAEMRVEVHTNKDEYRAGKEASLQVLTTDPSGKPVSADVAVSVFDKAVLYIQPELVPDIRKRFWGKTRTHAIVSASNLRRSYEGWQWLSRPDQQASSQFASAENTLMQGQLDLSSNERGGSALHGSFAKNDAKDAPAAPVVLAAPADKVARSEVSRDDDARENKKEGGRRRAAEDPAARPEVAPDVRRNFADTALWRVVHTDASGKATIDFKFPDNLTTWRIHALGLSKETMAGESSGSVITTKKLLVRLEAPRFFRERDRLMLSAIVHNRLAARKKVRVEIQLSEWLLEIEGPKSKTIEVDKDGEARVDWWVKVASEGDAVVRMSAFTDEESDAKEMSFPVLVHGFMKTDSRVGSIPRSAPDNAEKTIELSIPKERRKDRGELVVRWSPTLAGAMIDALPFLLDYPYGCTEQTMSRFVPAVITRRTLQIAGGWSLEDLERINKSLNPQELQGSGDASYGARKEREYRRYSRNPVFDTKLMNEMIAEGMERIGKMQKPGGGWGWWAGDQASIYTTAYVLFGLAEARASDVAIPSGMIERGLASMEQMIQEHIASYKDHDWVSDTDAYFAYVMSLFQRKNDALTKLLVERRGRLSVYGKSVLALALWNNDQKDDARLVLRNAEQFLKEDSENETAYVDTDARAWWYWWNDDVESNAYFLRALVTIRPQDPRAPMIVKWLLNHRKHGWYWGSTRDSAVTIAAFAQYMRATKEDAPSYDLEVLLDGKRAKSVHIDAKNLLTFDGELRIPSSELASGKHQLTIRRKGTGPVYFNAYLSYFTQEEDPAPSGLELKIARSYFKLVRKERKTEGFDQRGGSIALREAAYEKVPLHSGDRLDSGDLILVELMLESKNDYTFLAFEDPKPAGMEAVALRSGTTYGEAVANLELRDEKVVFFLSELAQGKLKLEYRLRAEIPGTFHAMPAIGFGMYAPELSASSTEMRLEVR
jgi:uncharacterized protein YfaS (alpha-2-macroglobulin family)